MPKFKKLKGFNVDFLYLTTEQFINWTAQPFLTGCHPDIKSTDFNIRTVKELVQVVEEVLDDIAQEEYVDSFSEIDLLESSLLLATRTKHTLGDTIINNSYMTYTSTYSVNYGIFIFYDINYRFAVKYRENDIKLASKYFIKFKQ